MASISALTFKPTAPTSGWNLSINQAAGPRFRLFTFVPATPTHLDRRYWLEVWEDGAIKWAGSGVTGRNVEGLAYPRVPIKMAYALMHCLRLHDVRIFD